MFNITEFPLPYAYDALAPYISQRTMEFHHDRHLGTYIKNLNDLIAGRDYADMPLVEIVKVSATRDADKKVFNNAAQVYNHDFFFHGIKPNGGGDIPPQIADAFGGPDAFREQFRTAATGVFGSGWAWLVRDGDALRIVTTANADTPIAHGWTPLMTLDLWEHAYYLDYQNRRAEFIDVFLDHLVDWDFVLENLTPYMV